LKLNLFIDFDSTLVDSIKAFCQVYNNKYKNHPKFQPADPDKIQRWDFQDICPLVDNINSIFESKEFFRCLEFFPYARDVVRELNKWYNVIICTIGTPKNLAHKIAWLQRNLPFINCYVLINNGYNIMDKSIVNMQGGIIIDDVASNLESSNASIKICFGKVYPWNEWWEGERAGDWLSIKELLL
jgi:5'(3')-deoxyribonucleotidase